ncbi:hypothetical protein FA95DRAFT_399177 [Auriscalpium vulgare]|uniref:Uncharacterized protein n=1 Tax=Auriscalpium vulgare TaxID=40419 RepID=A0ACB8RIQ0_9AGAM|nr:hypothetical protein FA95DRAFT_399177 [Auriscalpium vulgare]
MPAPAVYVVVAIGTVAAIYAFKELIYDPHVHPKVQAWQETMAARRRARKERTRRTAPVSARAPADSDDDDVPLASIRRRGSRDSEGSATTPVELENLVASEVQEWRSGVDVGRNQAGLRLRRLPDSQASSTLGSSVSLLDESDVFSISHTPLEPTPLHRPTRRRRAEPGRRLHCLQSTYPPHFQPQACRRRPRCAAARRPASPRRAYPRPTATS